MLQSRAVSRTLRTGATFPGSLRLSNVALATRAPDLAMTGSRPTLEGEPLPAFIAKAHERAQREVASGRLRWTFLVTMLATVAAGFVLAGIALLI